MKKGFKLIDVITAVGAVILVLWLALVASLLWKLICFVN